MKPVSAVGIQNVIKFIKRIFNKLLGHNDQSVINKEDSVMFEKVSFEVFTEGLRYLTKNIARADVEAIYNNIQLPQRSTENAAGYDFFSPVGLHIPADGNVIIPTGIKVNLGTCPNKGMRKFLALYPRSSLGFKYGMRLMNTVGIIDQDYYNNESNEGHILIAITTLKDFDLELNSKFCQGIIQPYYLITKDEVVETKRTGGVGSTDKVSEEHEDKAIEEGPNNDDKRKSSNEDSNEN